MIRLNTVYVSQEGPGASKPVDCGPACVLSLIQTVTGRMDLTVDAVSKKIPGFWTSDTRGVFITDLEAVSRDEFHVPLYRYSSGIKGPLTPAARTMLQAEIENRLMHRQPVIALLNYVRLPRANRWNLNFTGAHYVVIHGFDADMYWYDDPFWPYAANDSMPNPGENLQISKEALWHAMEGGVYPTPMDPDFKFSGQFLALRDHTVSEWHETMAAMPGGGAMAEVLHGAMAATPQVAVLPTIRWNRWVTGVSGDMVSMYEKGEVDPAIPYETFIEEVVARNAQLANTDYILQADDTYCFPTISNGVAWTRTVTGRALLTNAIEAVMAESGGTTGILEVARGGVTIIIYRIWSDEVVSYDIPMDFETFQREFLAVNSLTWEDALHPDADYYLPDAPTTESESDEVAWTQEVEDVEGTLDDIFNLRVAPRGISMKRDAFRREALRQNPHLLDTAHRFEKGQSYRLPVEARAFRSTENGHPAGLKPGAPLTAFAAAAAAPLDGWVRREGNRFVLKGQTFKFVGGNSKAILYWDHLFGFTGEQVDEHLNQLRHTLGGRVQRLFLVHNDFHDLQQRAQIWARLERLLPKLDARDLYAIVSFTDVHSDAGFKLKQDEQQGYYSHRPEGENKDFLNYAWYQHGYKVNYLPFVEATVKHFATHPLSHRIMAWDMGNELRAIPDPRLPPIDFRAVNRAFYSTVAGRIRSIEKQMLGNGRFHLITTGAINSVNASLGNEKDQASIVQFYQSAPVPEIDFLTFHIYPDKQDQTEMNRARFEVPITKNTTLINRPVVIEEFSLHTPGEKVPNGPMPTERKERIGAMMEMLRGWGADGILQWGFGGLDDNRCSQEEDRLRRNDFDWHEMTKAFRDHANG